MPSRKIITGVSAVAAAAALVGTGAALSGAATRAATPTPSATSSAGGGPGGHAHTPVTGDELAKVTAAVMAKDSAVTVTSVRKDPDGSYDVDGTKAGAPVRLEVSKDLKTITTATGRGGPGGAGGHAHTPVTGDELAKVTAAVMAKDSAVTVTSVRKDPDGSYDVDGTKAGARVHLEVSKDLKTITTRERPAGPGGPGGPGGAPDGSTTSTSTSTAV